MLFEPNTKEVAERIKNICKKLKKSPEEFAELLGVKLATVEKWLSGNGVPSKSNLKKMGNLVNLTPDEILYVNMDKFISDNIDLINDMFHLDFTKQDIAEIMEEEHITLSNLYRLEYILEDYKFDIFLNLTENRYPQFYKNPEHYKKRSLTDFYDSIDEFIYDNYESINNYFNSEFTEDSLIEITRRENITLDNAEKLIIKINDMQEKDMEYIKKFMSINFHMLGIMETLMEGSFDVISKASPEDREKFKEALLGSIGQYNFLNEKADILEFFDKVYKDELSKIMDKYNKNNILDIKRFK